MSDKNRDDLQDWTCKTCGRRFVVSLNATAHHGVCSDCGGEAFVITPHVRLERPA